LIEYGIQRRNARNTEPELYWSKDKKKILRKKKRNFKIFLRKVQITKEFFEERKESFRNSKRIGN
jgi:hypothetical protein